MYACYTTKTDFEGTFSTTNCVQRGSRLKKIPVIHRKIILYNLQHFCFNSSGKSLKISFFLLFYSGTYPHKETLKHG